MSLKPPGANLPDGYGQGSVKLGASGQLVSDNASTPIVWTIEEWDTAGLVDVTHDPSRVATAVVSGHYLVTANVAFPANATGDRILSISVNGVVVAASTFKGVATYQAGLSCVTVVDLDPGDYVQVLVFQDSGGALQVYGSGNGSNNGARATISRLG